MKIRKIIVAGLGLIMMLSISGCSDWIKTDEDPNNDCSILGNYMLMGSVTSRDAACPIDIFPNDIAYYELNFNEKNSQVYLTISYEVSGNPITVFDAPTTRNGSNVTTTNTFSDPDSGLTASATFNFIFGGECSIYTGTLVFQQIAGVPSGCQNVTYNIQGFYYGG